MKLLAATLACVLGLVGLAESQGFLGNCTWQSANLTGSLLGMYCNDDDIADYGYQWTCALYVSSLGPLPLPFPQPNTIETHKLPAFTAARI